MAPSIPTTEPTQATAGDTWRWTLSDSTFPTTDGFALSYAIRGVSALAWDASMISSSGTNHTITIPATATADLGAGTYEITRIWTGSGSTVGQVYSVKLPSLSVLPNPATAAAGERQSWEEKTLSIVEAVLAGRVTDDIQMYQIGGRTVSKMPLTELLSLRAQLKAVVAFRQTGSFGSRIRYAFTEPGSN